MSVEANTATVYRWFETLNRNDLTAAAQLWAPDYTFSNPMGIRDWKQFFTTFHQAFPDLRVAEQDVFAAEDKVATRWNMEGTQRGEFQGIQPTYRQVTTTGISIFRIVGGKIRAQWTEFDRMHLLQQLDVVLIR
jgi:steroid delta-isomerase-like uncharacterized protein